MCRALQNIFDILGCCWGNFPVQSSTSHSGSHTHSTWAGTPHSHGQTRFPYWCNPMLPIAESQFLIQSHHGATTKEQLELGASEKGPWTQETLGFYTLTAHMWKSLGVIQQSHQLLLCLSVSSHLLEQHIPVLFVVQRPEPVHGLLSRCSAGITYLPHVGSLPKSGLYQQG